MLFLFSPLDINLNRFLVLGMKQEERVYLGGGIPPRIISLVSKGTFMDCFTSKGDFSELVALIPIHVI